MKRFTIEIKKKKKKSSFPSYDFTVDYSPILYMICLYYAKIPPFFYFTMSFLYMIFCIYYNKLALFFYYFSSPNKSSSSHPSPDSCTSAIDRSSSSLSHPSSTSSGSRENRTGSFFSFGNRSSFLSS